MERCSRQVKTRPLELKVDLRNTRVRLRDQVIRDPSLHLVGLLRRRTTMTAVFVSRVALLHTGTEAAQRLQNVRAAIRGSGNPVLIKVFN